MVNNSCYRNEELKFPSGAFDSIIDGCYVLTMENSKRRSNYMHQLNTFLPVSKVTIVHNKGFKKCTKDLYEQNTIHDLNDAYANVFQQALNKNQERILIFEDDFFFDAPITTGITNDINKFITSTPDFDVYSLGCNSWFLFPISSDTKHYRFIGGSAHSVIYSKKYMESYLHDYYNKLITIQVDGYWYKYNLYCYHKPICFQLFVETENSKNWHWRCGYLIKLMVYLLNLDKQHQPASNILYLFAKTCYIFVILFVVVCIKKKVSIKNTILYTPAFLIFYICVYFILSSFYVSLYNIRCGNQQITF